MSDITIHSRGHGRTRSWRDRIEYRILVSIMFVLCIIALSLGRLVRAVQGRSSERQGSLLADARSAAFAAVGYAFIA